jgi:thiosulfate reductase/polysulfide reductase chain A
MYSRRSFLSLSAAIAAGAVAYPILRPDLSVFASTIESGTEAIPSFCEMCFWKCGIEAWKQDGKIIAITGHPDHPLSNGKLCPRGTGGIGSLYDPDRIKKPMIRSGDKWHDVSWDEAIGFTAERMQAVADKYGPSSMALISHGFGASFLKTMFKSFGSATFSAPSYAQCRGPRDAGFTLTFGQSPSSPEWTDMENSTLLILIGSHIGENMHNTQVQEFSKAVERGAEIVVVDPRFSVAAGKAKHWLPIKPGTDIALLLAWIHLLIKDEGYNKKYVQQHCDGFEQLAQEVLPYTPEWAYTQTGISPEKIRAVAKQLAMHQSSALIHPGRKSNWYGDDTQRARAVAILNALVGSWGSKGGFFLGKKFKIPSVSLPEFPASDTTISRNIKGQFPFASKIPTQALRDYTLDNADLPIKGWMVYGTDLFNNMPDKKKTIEAIKKLDFLAVIDILPIELAGWADIVLPDTTYLERYDDLHAPYWKKPYVALRQPVVKPMFDAKPSWWIGKQIAEKMGNGKYFPWKNIEEYLDTRLKKVGLTLEQMKKEGVHAGEVGDIYPEEPEFYTDSGRIELYSHKLKEKGFDPVPKYTPPAQPPSGFFRLLVGRAPVHTFGRTTNNKILTELYPENELWVNSISAKDFGIENGQRIQVVNQDGVKSDLIKVKVTERIRPDSVYMTHGFGRKTEKLHIANGKGSADNDLLTRIITDPIMGGTSTNTNFVTFLTEEEV